MSMKLFDSANDGTMYKEELGPGSVVLCGFASPDEAALLAALNEVIAQAPFRHRITPGGYRMSVAMTNCSSFGAATVPPLWHNCHLSIPGRARRTARSRDRRWAFRQRVHL